MTTEEDLHRSGYSREEEYFHKRNRELIDRGRKDLDARRATEAEAQRQSEHWMRCPQCGGPMEEVELLHVKAEQCARCRGLFLNAGELELLLHGEQPQALLDSIKRLLD
jgi:hypothetical protein